MTASSHRLFVLRRPWLIGTATPNDASTTAMEKETASMGNVSASRDIPVLIVKKVSLLMQISFDT